MTAALTIAGLRKVYPGRRPVVAVDGLDLRVERQEVFGLLGPNGAGKTTTVEICEGLLVPTAGEVRLLGDRWGEGRDLALRARMGVSLQSTDFFEKQTVREVLELFASFHDGGRGVGEAMELVGLAEKADARTAALSGGQRQRLAVATALLGRPELLFLDEPTTGLDPQSRRRLWEVVRGFRDAGGTVLLTTHYMEEAAALCDRIAVVDHGRIIAEGSPAELVARLGGDHVVEVTVGGASVQLAGGVLDGLPHVESHRIEGDTVVLNVKEVHRVLPGVLEILRTHDLEMDHLSMRHATLEDVFVELTGRHLRDGEEA